MPEAHQLRGYSSLVKRGTGSPASLPRDMQYVSPIQATRQSYTHAAVLLRVGVAHFRGPGAGLPYGRRAARDKALARRIERLPLRCLLSLLRGPVSWRGPHVLTTAVRGPSSVGSAVHCSSVSAHSWPPSRRASIEVLCAECEARPCFNKHLLGAPCILRVIPAYGALYT